VSAGASSRAEALAQIAEEIRTCRRCGEPCRTRTNAVPGEGPPDAPLMFVGEAPGEQEDKQGRPFVGPAGRLLTKLLESVRIPREKVFITNTIKCRPPGNRVPTPDEIARCLPYLIRQMAVIQPRIVCLLGATAAQALLGSDQKITRIRGKAFREPGRWFFATYHPAAALRNESVREALVEDFRRLRRLVDVEWGTETPTRWKAGALQKIFAGEEVTEPVVVSQDATLRVTWDIRSVHTTFRTESALTELLRRFLLRQRRSREAGTPMEVLHLEGTDERGRVVPVESPECLQLHAEVRFPDRS
jgi:uracil-DNA glycosylase family 4